MPTVAALALFLLTVSAWPRGVYRTADEFLAEVFARPTPDPAVLWLNVSLKAQAARILGHPYRGLRVRYWGLHGRTAWVLDEIGKERPITVGVVVDGGRIERVRVLAFRESRGGEVRYPFFVDQFQGAGLAAEWDLDRHIDGISGATLSVRALTRLAALALFFHRHTPVYHDPS